MGSNWNMGSVIWTKRVWPFWLNAVRPFWKPNLLLSLDMCPMAVLTKKSVAVLTKCSVAVLVASQLMWPFWPKQCGRFDQSSVAVLVVIPLSVAVLVVAILECGRFDWFPHQRQQHPSDLLSGAGTSRERSSRDVPAGQQITRVLLP